MIDFAPITTEKMTYAEAILYCQFLEHDGHRDWRLPTQDEYIPAIHFCWWESRSEFSDDFVTWWVQPVRDI